MKIPASTNRPVNSFVAILCVSSIMELNIGLPFLLLFKIHSYVMTGFGTLNRFRA
jgi:hypothetical protein